MPVAKWHDGLTMRGLKSIKTEGELFSKLFNNYKKHRRTNESLRQLTHRDLSLLANLTEARLSHFLAGVFEDIPNESKQALLSAILITHEEFRDFGKDTSIPDIGVFAPIAVTSGQLTPTKAAPKPQIPAKTAPEPRIADKATHTDRPASKTASLGIKSSAKPLKIENYIEEALVIVFDSNTNTLKINLSASYEKTAPKTTSAQKVIIAHGAVVFSGKFVPGKAEV